MAETVEVVYALTQCQCLKTVLLQDGMTVAEAIESSGLLEQFPEIDLEKHRVGVFGCVCRLDRRLNPGERVEIYRPLAIDPMEARRDRVNVS